MAVKTSIMFLSKDSDSQLVQDTQGIISGLTNNTHFPTPNPTLAVITAALDAFVAALGAAAGGGVALTAAKNAARAELAALLRQLGSYLHFACNGDMGILLTSNFPVQKEKGQPVGLLPNPTNLTVNNGPLSGQLTAGVAPVPNALVYNWQLTTTAAPNVIVQTQQTSAASAIFADLTPGTQYSVVANVTGTAGPSDWTNPVSQYAV